jgi:hypothetical protein
MTPHYGKKRIGGYETPYSAPISVSAIFGVD